MRHARREIPLIHKSLTLAKGPACARRAVAFTARTSSSQWVATQRPAAELDVARAGQLEAKLPTQRVRRRIGETWKGVDKVEPRLAPSALDQELERARSDAVPLERGQTIQPTSRTGLTGVADTVLGIAVGIGPVGVGSPGDRG
jgi:hypothetical protein